MKANNHPFCHLLRGSHYLSLCHCTAFVFSFCHPWPQFPSEATQHISCLQKLWGIYQGLCPVKIYAPPPLHLYLAHILLSPLVHFRSLSNNFFFFFVIKFEVNISRQAPSADLPRVPCLSHSVQTSHFWGSVEQGWAA